MVSGSVIPSFSDLIYISAPAIIVFLVEILYYYRLQGKWRSPMRWPKFFFLLKVDRQSIRGKLHGEAIDVWHGFWNRGQLLWWKQSAFITASKLLPRTEGKNETILCRRQNSLELFRKNRKSKLFKYSLPRECSLRLHWVSIFKI